MTPLRTALVAATLLLAVPACASDDGASPASTSAFSPTASPSPTVTLMPAPAEFSDVRGEGFSISAPPEFQRSERRSSNGQPLLVLEKPSSVPAVPQRVAVVRDVEPVSPAAEQSYALEVSKSAGNPDATVTRVQLPTEVEGASAYLVTWEENRATEGGATVAVTYWQLMYEADPSLILNVVAFAPSAEFEDSAVSVILRSFEPRSGAAA